MRSLAPLFAFSLVLSCGSTGTKLSAPPGGDGGASSSTASSSTGAGGAGGCSTGSVPNLSTDAGAQLACPPDAGP